MTAGPRQANPDPTPDGPPAELPPDAAPAERFAALRADFDAMVEVCRWQWNLIQRLRRHFERMPRDWPWASP